MSLRQNRGIAVIWSICAIILGMLFIYLLGSMTWLFPENAIFVLRWLVISFIVVATLAMW
jgi:hypothetical protein